MVLSWRSYANHGQCAGVKDAGNASTLYIFSPHKGSIAARFPAARIQSAQAWLRNSRPGIYPRVPVRRRGRSQQAEREMLPLVIGCPSDVALANGGKELIGRERKRESYVDITPKQRVCLTNSPTQRYTPLDRKPHNLQNSQCSFYRR